jgi:hypothetical protein
MTSRLKSREMRVTQGNIETSRNRTRAKLNAIAQTPRPTRTRNDRSTRRHAIAAPAAE